LRRLAVFSIVPLATQGDTATEGCVRAYGAWKPLKRDPETTENLPALCENTQPELCIENLCPRRPVPVIAKLLHIMSSYLE